MLRYSCFITSSQHVRYGTINKSNCTTQWLQKNDMALHILAENGHDTNLSSINLKKYYAVNHKNLKVKSMRVFWTTLWLGSIFLGFENIWL